MPTRSINRVPDRESSAPIQPDLDGVLELALGPCRERLLSSYPVLEDLLAGRSSAIVYPAANMARVAAKKLRQLGVNVVGFGDSNPMLWSQRMDDLPVWSPDEIALRHTDIPVLVASTVYDSAITEMLCRKGCTAVIPVAVLNLLLPDVFVSREHFRSLDAVANPANHDAIRRVYDSLDDEESRRVYTTKLLFYLTQEKALLDGILSEHPIYFEPNIVSISPEEVMVDGGAYTGDTLRDFLSFCENSFGSYYAFEPDPANFSQLAATYEVDGVRVIAVQAGLANRSGRLRFQSGLSMASKLVSDADAGEETIEVVSLDEFFTDRPAPTFIKMDIEGSERGALQGCSNIVARHQPKLAISAYHHAWDLWELPLLLLSMNPHYRLQLRHYTREIADTVCYAIPA